MTVQDLSDRGAIVPSQVQGEILSSTPKMESISVSQGGGGTLIFSAYIGSDPASTVHPQKKYQEFQAPQKNIWNFSNPKKIPILYLDLKKRP